MKVLVPNSACKFLASWQGPYTVTEKIGPITYRVHQPGRRRADHLYHINLLKKWVGTKDQLAALITVDAVVVDVGLQLSAAQKAELQHLVGQFSDVFSPTPGRTQVLHNEIRMPPGNVVRQWPYRVPEARRLAIEEEIQQMLKLGYQNQMAPSASAMTSATSTKSRSSTATQCLGKMSSWIASVEPVTSPHLTLQKGTGKCPSLKLPNQDGLQHPQWTLAVPDPSLRAARGSCHVPAHDGNLAAAPPVLCRSIPGWRGNPLRALGRPLRPSAEGADGTAQAHRQPPQMSTWALSEAKYLGRGLIKPQEKKVEAVRSSPRPSTKSQVRAFLGLAGYYRCFIPNFSSLAAPPDIPDQEGAARKGVLVTWGGGDLSEGEDSAYLGAGPAGPRLQRPLPAANGCLWHRTWSGPVPDPGRWGASGPVYQQEADLGREELRTVEKEALAIKWAVLELRY